MDAAQTSETSIYFYKTTWCYIPEDCHLQHYKTIQNADNSYICYTGRGSGSYVGGWLISVMGTRESFRIMGFLAIAGGMAYGLLHYFWLRKVELSRKDEDAAAAAAGNATHDSKATDYRLDRCNQSVNCSKVDSTSLIIHNCQQI
jgi:hypothetical protein